MAALKRRQYCFGEMTVGSLPAPPPRITEDLTHVSSCLSQVYCRQQHAGVELLMPVGRHLSSGGCMP